MPKKHWLYGIGPDKLVTFKKEIDIETDCSKCFHNAVCNFDFRFRCVNFEFSNSMGAQGCQQCAHSFTRFDGKQPIPCFHCEEFVDSDIIKMLLKKEKTVDKRN